MLLEIIAETIRSVNQNPDKEKLDPQCDCGSVALFVAPVTIGKYASVKTQLFLCTRCLVWFWMSEGDLVALPIQQKSRVSANAGILPHILLGG